MKEEKQTIFEQKIKPKLVYVGTLGAVLMAVAYIVCVIVMIFGFQAKSVEHSILYATVNGIVGFIIMQFLKIQGIDFAKDLEANKATIQSYNKLQLINKPEKKKKAYTLKHYWATSLINDAASKMFTIVLASAGIIYIVIEGTSDYSLLLLAAVNLLMFVCFGFLALCQAYEFYNTQYIPYIEDQIKQLTQTKLIKEEEGAQLNDEFSDRNVEQDSNITQS